MKLEKISENQIRCTLNQSDLIEREIKMTELAYGTQKIRDLFKDMMEQASEELGFEAEGIPLVIEAIPLSSDCITLIITKVENPEELDTRFSRFSAGRLSEDDVDEEDLEDLMNEESSDDYVGADEILDFFSQIQKNLFGKTNADAEDASSLDAEDTLDAMETEDDLEDASEDLPTTADIAQMNITRIFSFSRLDDITDFAIALHGDYPEDSRVYKQPSTGTYLLVIEKGEQSPESFNRICNIASEYGRREKFTYGTIAYYMEHYDTIIRKNALKVLAELI